MFTEKVNIMKKGYLKKVFIIGSGPIVIGQAAEFDYAGTQGCKALKEEALEVVLLNNNPATIMTDMEVADKVYMEPMTVEVCEKIIEKERPQGIIATLGGQTGLNLAMELARRGILYKYSVELLGTSLNSIENAEDREKFKTMMESIGEPIAESIIANNVSDALKFAGNTGYPLIIRPAYTLGGTGGGVAEDEESLKEITDCGIKSSPIGQVLVEKSLIGYKEIEYEVMRDAGDSCITVCNMENIDPVGIHTGDSFVVAPSQTLTDEQYQLLRSASLNIIRKLKIEGGCNVQFALSPYDNSYYVIEVNPRVSRSSALASKVTGYPIAKIAAKIAVGYRLHELKNPITQKSACFEPSLDYVVVKAPKWPFDKFIEADKTLGTQMKSTGEGMAIDTVFEAAFLKSMTSVGIDFEKLDYDPALMNDNIKTPSSERMKWIMNALKTGVSVDKISKLSGINSWFIKKINNIVSVNNDLSLKGCKLLDGSERSCNLIKKAKLMGIGDDKIALKAGISQAEFRAFRKALGIKPVYKMVDTCAAEFYSSTPYYYSTYGDEEEAAETKGNKVIVLGSGPIRIGQGIEFDYCCVHCAWALKKLGIEAIMINNNPETVSTDFDTSDKLYFEHLTLESVLDIIDKEKPIGVIAQFGGQTALNLVKPLTDAGVLVLGTEEKYLDAAEQREKFNAVLKELSIGQPKGKSAVTIDEARKVLSEIGYPALIRPSYVIGGQAMRIVRNIKQFEDYVQNAMNFVSAGHPLLIDKYLEGKEAEIDGIACGDKLKIVGIMEHIERAGVHSGDSISLYPAAGLSNEEADTIADYSARIARALRIYGMVNIQYVIYEGKVYVIEVNPRASRTVPILSKVTGVNMIEEAVNIMMDLYFHGPQYFKDISMESIVKAPPYFVVKTPVFSTFKLNGADMLLGPEMKSTGETISLGKTPKEAIAKSAVTSEVDLKKKGSVLLSLENKCEAGPIANLLISRGYSLLATEGTADILNQTLSVPCIKVGKDSMEMQRLLKDRKVSFVVNTSDGTSGMDTLGRKIRRMCLMYKIPCFTCIDTISAFLNSLKSSGAGGSHCLSFDEYMK
jgi:carbamoyl-phosphate synthase, large subunit